jgi:hypothetical protein
LIHAETGFFHAKKLAAGYRLDRPVQEVVTVIVKIEAHLSLEALWWYVRRLRVPIAFQYRIQDVQ